MEINRVKFTQPKSLGGLSHPTPHLYVANCGPAVGLSLERIAAAFGTFGTVTGVQVADESGTRVVVTFRGIAPAQAAKEAWDGTPCSYLDARVLHMQYSVPQAPCQEPEEEEQPQWFPEEIGTMANRERTYTWMQEMAAGLPAAERDTLRRCGLYRASQTRLCRFDQALCREVIGYWDDVSHMFRFPRVHMTITLEDIYRLLGVPITGATPTYTVPDDYDVAWAELTEQDPMDRLAPGNRQGVNLRRHGLLGCGNLKKVVMAVMESRLIQSQTTGLLPVETYMLVRGCLRGETYDWGGYVLARVYEQLSRVRRNRGGGLTCTSLLQAWVWEHFPPLRSSIPTQIRGHQARLLRWDSADPRRAAIGRRETTYMMDIQANDIVWEPYQSIEWREDEQMCPWFDRTEVRGRLRNRDNQVMVHSAAHQRRIEESEVVSHHLRREQAVPQGGEQDVPQGGEHDMPQGGEQDEPHGNEQDAPHVSEQDVPQGGEQGEEVPRTGHGQEVASQDLTGVQRYTTDDIGTFIEWMTAGLWPDEVQVRVAPVPPFREDARVFTRVQRAVETIREQRQEIAHLRGEIAGLTRRRYRDQWHRESEAMTRPRATTDRASSVGGVMEGEIGAGPSH